jgi:mannose-6-phosphate isomerase-like protein (cupin superfamily)
MAAPPDSAPGPLAHAIRAGRVVLATDEFDALLDFLVERLGFRLAAIFPADSPSVATLDGHGLALCVQRATAPAPPLPALRLTVDAGALPPDAPRALTGPGGLRVELVDPQGRIEVPEGRRELVIARLPQRDGWGVGRAGMLYRDLIPGRLGGRFIASHILIPGGGAVPDYVHYHHVRFQLIFCRAGWVRVVYEDQGPPFVLRAGDCVLQPPGIRHRVLEASRGLEVVEIGCPAVHETRVDHELALPTAELRPARSYGGQRFVRHVAAEARWQPGGLPGGEFRDTGIGAATDGLAGVRVLRAPRAADAPPLRAHGREFHFVFVLAGTLELELESHGRHALGAGDSAAIPSGEPFGLLPCTDVELLEVTLPPLGE